MGATIAVGGTAMVAACGSTVALSFCFSPYVHILESTPPSHNNDDDNSTMMLRAVTRNILAREVETVFDPATDVLHDTKNRPFCNFVAKGVPMYVHKELIADQKLYTQLLGKPMQSDDEIQKENNSSTSKKDDDDIF